MFVPAEVIDGPKQKSPVQAVSKTSFASGEWAPKLRSRVDIQKYHSGAQLLRNFFVDYSGGGASTRQGTKFINQARALGSRLIPFQPTTTLSYILEFGQNYIRFYSNGFPVLEATTTISGVTQANPGVVTDTAHGYSNGDWIFISNVGGMTQLNGNFYIVQNVTANTYTLTDTGYNGATAINTSTFSAYTSGGTAQRVYTIGSPYNASDLFPNQATGNPGIKFVQDVTSLIITHPSYPVQILTIFAPTNWTISSANYGATIPTPTGLAVASTDTTGTTWFYSYLVTAVDVNGQESGPPTPVTFAGTNYIGSTQLANTISWTGVPGAASYNVYKAVPTFKTTVPAGSIYGFIANVTSTSFLDSFPGITPDFGQTPPIPENPFLGAGVLNYTITNPGSYTTVPTATVAAPPNGQRATVSPVLGVTVATVNGHGPGGEDVIANSNPIGALLIFGNGVVLKVTSATPAGGSTYTINSVSIQAAGSITSGSTPANPIAPSSFTLPITLCTTNFNFNFTWGVTQMNPISPGSGYLASPGVTFSSGSAAATANLAPASAGNPGVCAFIQERLVLLGQPQNIQGFQFSQPNSFFNFNITNPIQDDDAISGSIISEELNDIRWAIPVPTGLLAGTGKAAWLLNGGGGISTQNPITPTNITAQSQAFNGVNDLRPIKINFDLLYATNKGNYVRDLSYNLYAQIFTGSDISVLSNHLFFGFNLLDWAWAEEPFKTVWAVRSDGQMLSLGYVKEQEMLGWAHHDTNGQFGSVCSVIETVNGNVVDAVYLKVQRTVNGNVVEYIERMADRYFPYGYEDAWSVDCGLQTTPANQGIFGNTIASFSGTNVVGNSVTITFSASISLTSPHNLGWIIRSNGGLFTITSVISGSQCVATVTQAATSYNLYTLNPWNDVNWTIWQPVNTVTGLTQLVGQTVVGVADGAVVGPFTVSATGSVALGVTATKVTLGLAFLPQLQTLPLDLGEPTVQGKRKKIAAVTARVADTLGLQIGTSFANAVTMKDFTLGNIGSASNQLVTGLVNGDGRTIIDQDWQEAGNYCIQQTLPYPATVLGCFPEILIGDR